MDPLSTTSPSNDGGPAFHSRLESIPPECFNHVLDYLADDCVSMHSLLLMNRTLFHRTVPRLYQSPFVAIDATWPRTTYPARLFLSNDPQRGHGSSREPGTPTSPPGSTQGRGSRLSPANRLGQSRQVQLLWVFFNCLVHYSPSQSIAAAATMENIAEIGDHVKPGSSLERYKPTLDYLALYTHMNHPGLRFVIIQLFPAVEDASDVEYLLVQHAADKVRTLFLDWLQMDKLVGIVPRFSSLVSLKLGHEELQVQSAIDFVERHQQLYGTIMELDIEAYLPNMFEAKMDPAIGRLVGACPYLRSLSLSGFESLTIDLELIPTTYLRTLRINCGYLGRLMTDARGTLVMDAQQERSDPSLSVHQFLSRCRSLEHLMLRSVQKNTLEWAVQERRAFEVSQNTRIVDAAVTQAKTTVSDTSSVRSFSSNTSASDSVTATTTREGSPLLLQRPISLRTIHISGMDSEQAALVASQAAEAFAETLESIHVDSFSYQSNPTLAEITWKKPLSRLRHLQLDGRSNLPFRFSALRLCPNLRHLDLSRYIGMCGCSEMELLHLQSLKKLVRLDLSVFDHLTDWTLDTILSGLTSLQYLRLSLAESTGSMTTSRGTPVASNCPCRKLTAPVAAPSSSLPTVQEGEEGGGGGIAGEEGEEMDPKAIRGSEKGIHDAECPFSSGPSRNGIMSLSGILASVDRHLLPHLKQLAVILRRKMLDEHLLMLEMYSSQHPELEVVPFRGNS